MTLQDHPDPVEPPTRSGSTYHVPRMLCADCEKPLVAESVWWDLELGEPKDRPAIWLGKVHLILGCDNFLCSSEATVRLVVL